MKSVFATIVFGSHLMASAGMPTDIVIWSTPAVRGEVRTTGSEIHYVGDIDAVVAKSIVILIEQQKFGTLLIDSKGGDEVAARTIGAAIFDHQMNVVVSGQCSSSCARYIFTAAKQKQIKPEAFVMFSEHQSYHEYVQGIVQLSEKNKAQGTAALSYSERGTLATGEKWVGLEKNYFSRIGVDMGITSLGYIPGRSVSYWLMTEKRMAEFGVLDIALPDNYGSQEYCDRLKFSGLLRFDAQCF